MEERGELGTYQPVSSLAAAAVAAGGLSAAALFSPVFWVLPLLGVLLALLALRDVSRPGAVKLGRAAALLGLALSVGFGCQAVTGTLVKKWLLDSRAKQVALAWVEAIREGRLQEAQSMMSPQLLQSPDRPGAGEFAQPQPNPNEAPAAVFFRGLPSIGAIKDCGGRAVADASLTGDDSEAVENEQARHVVVRLEPCATGGPVVLRLDIAAAIQNQPAGAIERWMINDIKVGD